MGGGDRDFDGTDGRTSLYSHHGHRGLLHVLMARCTHTWVNVSTSTVDLLERKSKYSTLWATLTQVLMPWSFTMHVGLVVDPQAQHTSKLTELVLRSQTHLHFLWVLSCIYALLQKQPLAFRVCPTTQPIMILHTLLSFRRPSHLFCGSCFSPQAWLLSPSPSSPNRFSGYLLHSSGGYCSTLSLSSAAALAALNFSISCFLFSLSSAKHYYWLLPFPRGWVMGSKLPSCLSELMNTPTGASGE